MNRKRFWSFVLAAACLTTAPPHFGASAQQPAGPPTPQTEGQFVSAAQSACRRIRVTVIPCLPAACMQASGQGRRSEESPFTLGNERIEK